MDKTKTATNDTNPGKRLYTISEMVEEIGGTKSYWRSQIYKGRLPFVKVGKKIFIDSHDLDACINKNKFRH